MTSPKLVAVCPADGHPATGRNPYPHLCWGCTPETEDMYPVLITYTQQHVLWVRAADQESAVKRASYDTWEKTSDSETLVSTDCRLKAPQDEWDWETVYEGEWSMPYQGLEYDEHVKTRQEWLRKLNQAHAAAKAEDEDRDGVPVHFRRTCGVCRTWLEAGHEGSLAHRWALQDAERAAATAAVL